MTTETPPTPPQPAAGRPQLRVPDPGQSRGGLGTRRPGRARGGHHLRTELPPQLPAGPFPLPSPAVRPTLRAGVEKGSWEAGLGGRGVTRGEGDPSEDWGPFPGANRGPARSCPPLGGLSHGSSLRASRWGPLGTGAARGTFSSTGERSCLNSEVTPTPRSKDPRSRSCRPLAFPERTADTVPRPAHPGGPPGGPSRQGSSRLPPDAALPTPSDPAEADGDARAQGLAAHGPGGAEPGRRAPCAGATGRQGQGRTPARSGGSARWAGCLLPTPGSRLGAARLLAAAADNENHRNYTSQNL